MFPFSGYPDGWHDPNQPYESHDRDNPARHDDPAERENGWPDTNSWIADQIAITLRSDSRIYGRYVQILVQNRVVILLGEVASVDARAAASEAAWTVPDVYDVCNRLAVVSGPPADG